VGEIGCGQTDRSRHWGGILREIKETSGHEETRAPSPHERKEWGIKGGKKTTAVKNSTKNQEPPRKRVSKKLAGQKQGTKATKKVKGNRFRNVGKQKGWVFCSKIEDNIYQASKTGERRGKCNGREREEGMVIVRGGYRGTEVRIGGPAEIKGWWEHRGAMKGWSRWLALGYPTKKGQPTAHSFWVNSGGCSFLQTENWEKTKVPHRG